MERILLSVLIVLNSLIACSSNAENVEFVLSKFMKAKSSSNYDQLREYFPKATDKEFDYYSKPENYEIIERLEVGTDLNVIHGFEKGDLILKVQESKPDEIVFYTFRQNNGRWNLIGFEVEDAFYDHKFN